jgi:DNA helicase-2/ATP-dependent DNA helicase PcrA
MADPTAEQRQIIDEVKSCVVIAIPGSGKTFTLARKIQTVIPELPYYRGVIAISYTNKASDELKHRSTHGLSDKKSSFFGTIDKFCISEVVIPFVRHRYGLPGSGIARIVRLSEAGLDTDAAKLLAKQIESTSGTADIGFLIDRYKQGHVYLESVGKLANWLFDNVESCRLYLKARYTHVFIDEYQDSGFEQHQLFLKLKALGLVAVAVGDLNQSIFAFSKKSSKHLFDLTQSADFEKFSLTKNRRCHQSIAAYATKLINQSFNVDITDEKRVFLKIVTGDESSIGEWISGAIPKVKERFVFSRNLEIAILVRGARTAELVCSKLKVPFHYVELTPLDEVPGELAPFFIECLRSVLDPAATITDLVEKLLESDSTGKVRSAVFQLLVQARDLIDDDSSGWVSLLIDAAKLSFPKVNEPEAVHALLEVSTNRRLLDSYRPPRPDEVQVMTLHKSKGLEFEVVFHLDLYDWILPGYEWIKNNDKEDWIQTINLHYVGITRAKKACFLCSSTSRHKSDGTVVTATTSRFVTRSDLSAIRTNLKS